MSPDMLSVLIEAIYPKSANGQLIFLETNYQL